MGCVELDFTFLAISDNCAASLSLVWFTRRYLSTAGYSLAVNADAFVIGRGSFYWYCINCQFV